MASVPGARSRPGAHAGAPASGIIDWNGGDAAYVASGCDQHIRRVISRAPAGDLRARPGTQVWKYQPVEVAVERDVRGCENADSALKLGLGTGRPRCAAHHSQRDGEVCSEYSAREIKMAVSRHRRRGERPGFSTW